MGMIGRAAAIQSTNRHPRPRRRSVSVRRKNKSVVGCFNNAFLTRVAKTCKRIRDGKTFQTSIIVVILLAGCLIGVQTYDTIDQGVLDAVDVLDGIVLAVFVFEFLVKILAEGNRPQNFFKDVWNVFDFVIIAVGVMPFGGQAVTVLRLVRLLRVLKLVRALPKLRILVMGLLKSLSSIAYIGLLLLLLFYLYAVLGVSVFGGNDPVHFGELHTALLTLFRCATLEDWTDVMYIAMEGCENFGYAGIEEQCVDSKGHPLLASMFFVSFIVLSSMMILNLFIGVITSSMQDAKVALTEEMLNDKGRDPEDESKTQHRVIEGKLKDLSALMSAITTEVFAFAKLEKQRKAQAALARRSLMNAGRRSKGTVASDHIDLQHDGSPHGSGDSSGEELDVDDLPTAVHSVMVGVASQVELPAKLGMPGEPSAAAKYRHALQVRDGNSETGDAGSGGGDSSGDSSGDGGGSGGDSVGGSVKLLTVRPFTSSRAPPLVATPVSPRKMTFPAMSPLPQRSGGSEGNAPIRAAPYRVVSSSSVEDGGGPLPLDDGVGDHAGDSKSAGDPSPPHGDRRVNSRRLTALRHASRSTSSRGSDSGSGTERGSRRLLLVAGSTSRQSLSPPSPPVGPMLPGAVQPPSQRVRPLSSPASSASGALACEAARTLGGRLNSMELLQAEREYCGPPSEADRSMHTLDVTLEAEELMRRIDTHSEGSTSPPSSEPGSPT